MCRQARVVAALGLAVLAVMVVRMDAGGVAPTPKEAAPKEAAAPKGAASTPNTDPKKIYDEVVWPAVLKLRADNPGTWYDKLDGLYGQLKKQYGEAAWKEIMHSAPSNKLDR